MGVKKCRRMRKIVVPTDTPTEFKLEDTVADIQRRDGVERTERGGGGGTETTEGGEGESQEGENYTLNRAGSGQKVTKN